MNYTQPGYPWPQLPPSTCVNGLIKEKSIYQQMAQLVPMGRYATQMASLWSGRMLLWDVTCPN